MNRAIAGTVVALIDKGNATLTLLNGSLFDSNSQQDSKHHALQQQEKKAL